MKFLAAIVTWNALWLAATALTAKVFPDLNGPLIALMGGATGFCGNKSILDHFFLENR